jgi:hypothetical protein
MAIEKGEIRPPIAKLLMLEKSWPRTGRRRSESPYHQSQGRPMRGTEARLMQENNNIL